MSSSTAQVRLVANYQLMLCDWVRGLSNSTPVDRLVPFRTTMMPIPHHAPPTPLQTYPGAATPAPSAPAAQPLLDLEGQPNSSGDAFQVVQMNNAAPAAGNPSARTKRQALGSAVCMAILAIVLLLTFLIPRSPSVSLSGGAVGLSGAPIYVNASFELHNRNWYSTVRFLRKYER